MFDELVKSAAHAMTGKLEGEIVSALNRELPHGWLLVDIVKRCRWVRVSGQSFETFYLDDKPLFEIGPIQTEQINDGEKIPMRYWRDVRRFGRKESVGNRAVDKIWINGVLHIADEEVIAKLNSLVFEREKYREALETIRDFSNDQDCLPGCDSFAHEEMCPYCNPEMVLKRMANEALK